jgi:TolB-like protein
MMHFLRKVVREVHRRSVWQVLGVYLVASACTFQVVEVATEFAGLPGWTPGMALGLLLIGLPIVITTAFVQEGVRGLLGDPNDEIDPNELEGLTPDQVHRGRKTRDDFTLFTWRNAVLSGVGALALLLSSVSAYLFMWAFGFGPVGSLVAQGVLEVQDRVILAEVENHTGDETLGAVVTDALREDLVQSRMITVLDRRLVDELLRRMGLSTAGQLTAGLAHEVAVREGIKVVVEGDVSRAGSGYVVGARLVVPGAGVTLAAFRERVEEDDGLRSAVHRLSLRLREKAGESLRDIRSARRQRQASLSPEI